eukprot:1161682-Pelagomonas_calceolata.AAC.1
MNTERKQKQGMQGRDKYHQAHERSHPIYVAAEHVLNRKQSKECREGKQRQMKATIIRPQSDRTARHNALNNLVTKYYILRFQRSSIIPPHKICPINKMCIKFTGNKEQC